MKPLAFFLSLALATLLASLARADETAARTAIALDGERFSARLVEVDAAWQLTFEVDGERRQVQASELVAWGAPRDPRGGARVLLPHQGVLMAEPNATQGELLEVQSFVLRDAADGDGTLKLPFECLVGFVLQAPGDTLLRDQQEMALRRGPGGADRLLLDNGDELTGLLVAIGDDEIEFEAEVGKLQIEWERLAAVAFDAELMREAEPTGPHALVGLGDGSRLLVTSLVVADGTAELVLLDGTRWYADADELVYLQPLGGRATYVSDLQPESYRHVPFLDLSWPYHLDRNVRGGRLRSGGELYLKGVGMHSTARLTWNVGGEYRRFEADVALDDSTGGRGSVTFRVFADGTEKYASPVVRGGDEPLPISVDVGGATRVSLIVDYADRGDELDHANWLNARLLP